jgi:hypothetical protein
MAQKMIRASRKKIIQDWVEKYAIDGIISDNRLGVLSKKTLFFITPIECDNRNTTWITSKIHQTIKKTHKDNDNFVHGRR